MPSDRTDRLRYLGEGLNRLSDRQLDWIAGVVRQFALTPQTTRDPASDFVTDGVLQAFGDALQIHHCFSREALSKDRFEYALHRVLNDCGIPASLAPKGNPGHDITIRNERFSLKTQADKNIRRDQLHISKFMELGKGAWGKEEDLVGLRNQFLKHMDGYDRMLQLRRLTDSEVLQEYELVEIPKELLRLATSGRLSMDHESTQSPKPGHCIVTNELGGLAFELYFDGGTERKLQIRKLDKQLCRVHATWKIRRVPLSPEVT